MFENSNRTVSRASACRLEQDLAITAIVRLPEGKGKVLAVPKVAPLLRRFIQVQLARVERQFQAVRAGWPGT